MAVILLILGFMWWWPLGLVILAILIAGGRIGCWHRPTFAGSGRWAAGITARAGGKTKCSACRTRWTACARKVDSVCGGNMWGKHHRRAAIVPSTTIAPKLSKRLEDEQREFRDFLDRLRFAKDKTEFDQFMADRRSCGDDTGPQPQSP